MISGPEIAVIAIVALLLFGPDKIPQVLKTLKKAVGIYAEARDQVQEVVTTHVISQEELDLLKDPLGLKGGTGSAAGSKGALLTPERTSLYNQTMPVPAAHVSAPVEAPVADLVADSVAAQTMAAPVAAHDIHQSETVSPASAPLSEAQAPVTPDMPTQAVPAAVEATPAPTAPTSAAASIWASLEQTPPEQAPPAQNKDEMHNG